MKILVYLMIALPLILMACSARTYTASERAHLKVAHVEGRAMRDIASVDAAAMTIYPPQLYFDQTALAQEEDTVRNILTTFSVEKLSNELARRNLLALELDSTLIDSLVFPISDTILRKSLRFSKYMQKTGDSIYFNAIYDFRRELWEIDEDSIHKNARAVAMIVPTTMLSRINGKWFMKTESFYSFRELCPGEKFYNQPCSMGCAGTGFAVRPQYVVTAYHSVIQYRDAISVIYDFEPDSVRNGMVEIPDANIYSATVTDAHGGYDLNTDTYPGGDFAVLKTSRPIPDDRILRLTAPDSLPRGDLYMIGHPDGLSLKVISNGRILEEKDSLQYRSEMHSMPGCSGAPVFDSDHRLVAIQLGRESGGDYEWTIHDGVPCKVTRRCPTLQCEGMDLLKVEVIIKALKKLQ